MTRMSRAEVFAADEIAIVHVMNRVVRRCFLMGYDELTGKNYEHRKQWIEEQFERLAAYFAIDLLCFSVMSNHFHQVLRSRPDIARSWSNREVARRWLMLCPSRKRKNGLPCEPKEAQIRAITENDKLLREIRSRLSDISWWMRLLCQRIARRCNAEDEMTGKFWESRFRAVRLLDEESVLACAAYVDLNPIRAAIAEDLEHSDHTSIQLRLRDINMELTWDAHQESDHAVSHSVLQSIESRKLPVNQSDRESDLLGKHAAQDQASVDSPALQNNQLIEARSRNRASDFLAPLEIDEQRDELGARPSHNGRRASDKGFLSMPFAAYVQILDWTARKLVAERQGKPFEELSPVFERFGIRHEVWFKLVTQFGALFSAVAGRPQKVDSIRSRKTGAQFYMPKSTRELLSV